MTRYENLKGNPKKFLSLTGYTLEEFTALAPYFSKRFLEFVETKPLDGNPRRKRKYTTYANSCLPTLEDKLLFILIYLRKAMTQDVLGELFGIDQPVANKWIHRLLPVLNRALADLGGLPFRETSISTSTASTDTSVEDPNSMRFFHDGTERPIRCPKDRETQKAHYSGKKKQHTVKNNLMIDTDSKVVFLTPSCEGRIHDKRIADMARYSPPMGSILYQDSGFQGFTLPGIDSIQPKRSRKVGT